MARLKRGRPHLDPSDPQVGINGELIKAKVEESGLGYARVPKELKRKTGVYISPATLNEIATGKQATTRRSIRQALAKFFGLEEALLSKPGHETAAERGAQRFRGFAPSVIVTSALAHLMTDADVQLEDIAPLYELRKWRELLGGSSDEVTQEEQREFAEHIHAVLRLATPGGRKRADRIRQLRNLVESGEASENGDFTALSMAELVKVSNLMDELGEADKARDPKRLNDARAALLAYAAEVTKQGRDATLFLRLVAADQPTKVSASVTLYG